MPLTQPSRGRRPRIAILVPAHNESTGVLPTLSDLKQQLSPGDRLIVVADNCIDDTADVAAGAGAEVIERHEPGQHGKGFALDFGIRHLNLDPPEVVIVVDADCRTAEATIEQLATTCINSLRPVQANNQMRAPEGSSINYHVAEFAWRVKNWLRPLGLYRLGLPCQLTGTGMAFPWEIIRSINLATGSIVEDLELGLNLTRRGSPPLFCPTAEITSFFPATTNAAENQRARWEHGHIGIIFTGAPCYLIASIMQLNFSLLALTLDLAIPPLSLLALILVGMTIVAAIASIAFDIAVTALIINALFFALFVVAVFVAWFKSGRDILPLRSVLSIFFYLMRKLPIYWRVATGRSTSRWIRTDRE